MPQYSRKSKNNGGQYDGLLHMHASSQQLLQVGLIEAPTYQCAFRNTKIYTESKATSEGVKVFPMHPRITVLQFASKINVSGTMLWIDAIGFTMSRIAARG